jgi:hypothetical protein
MQLAGGEVQGVAVGMYLLTRDGMMTFLTLTPTLTCLPSSQ